MIEPSESRLGDEEEMNRKETIEERIAKKRARATSNISVKKASELGSMRGSQKHTPPRPKSKMSVATYGNMGSDTKSQQQKEQQI